jgi:hypothetical protein
MADLTTEQGSSAMVDLAVQISCVKREIALRERVYPRQVKLGRMAEGKADQELVAMRAVLATLEALKAADRRLGRHDG